MRFRFWLRCALALALIAAVAEAQAPSAAGPKPTLALVGGQVIDGYEGPPIHDGVILIAGDRIVAVGPRSEVAVPPGIKVISTEGMSVMPGLMDMHVHLMIVGHADYKYWDTTYMKRFRDEIMPVAAKQLLMAGVTTVRDLGAPLDDILEVKRRIQTGAIPGPRLFVSGPFIQHAPFRLHLARTRHLGEIRDDSHAGDRRSDPLARAFPEAGKESGNPGCGKTG